MKELIKKHYEEANAGMFFTRNIVVDDMTTIYNGQYFTLDICYFWMYYELFGCTESERKEIEELYKELKK